MRENMSHIFRSSWLPCGLQFLQAAIALPEWPGKRLGRWVVTKGNRLVNACSLAHNLHLALGQIMSHISRLTGINNYEYPYGLLYEEKISESTTILPT
jgi:hypothetical protein